MFSGMSVFVQGCAATPLALLSAMAEHGKKNDLRDVSVMHIHTEGPGIYVKPEYQSNNH